MTEDTQTGMAVTGNIRPTERKGSHGARLPCLSGSELTNVTSRQPARQPP